MILLQLAVLVLSVMGILAFGTDVAGAVLVVLAIVAGALALVEVIETRR